MKKLLTSLVALTCLTLPLAARADYFITAPYITNTKNWVEHTLMITTAKLVNRGRITATNLVITAKNIHSAHDKNLGLVCWKDYFILNYSEIKYHDPRCG